MSFGLTEKAIRKINSVFASFSSIDEVILYGSRAKGNYKQGSDVDLTLKGDNINLDLLNKISLKIDELLLPIELDISIFRTLENKELIDHINRIGVVFYKRDLTNWISTSLRDTSTDISYGYTASASNKPIGPKFLRITDIVNEKINWGTVPYCEIDKAVEQKYKLQPGDIVIARTGATTGYNTIIKETTDAVFASYLIRYRINKQIANPFYIGYLLKSYEWKGFVQNIMSGSAQPGANAQQFADFEFELPPINKQNEIVEVLGSLDNKIDLLGQQNKTLEALAETIFRQWFLEEQKETSNKVTLGDIATFYTGKSRPMEKENGNVPIYGGNGVLGFTNKSNYNEKSIIIGRVGAYCGSLYFVNGPIWVSDNALLVKTKKSNQMHYLFYLLKSFELNSMAEGSSHPLITQTLLKSIEINSPSIEKIELFDAQVDQYFQKITFNNSQIKTLNHLIDTLLPKLMGGEVRVEI